jgi:hypothetical protein
MIGHHTGSRGSADDFVPLLSIPFLARRADSVPLSIHFIARRADFVGQVGNLRPIGNRPSGITYKWQQPVCSLAALWGSQSWLQPAFSRLLNSLHVITLPANCTQALPPANHRALDPSQILKDRQLPNSTALIKMTSESITTTPATLK